MKIEQTKLPGVLILSSVRFGDRRGFFSENWNRKTLVQHGITLDGVAALLSDKDARAPLLRDFDTPFVYEG